MQQTNSLKLIFFSQYPSSFWGLWGFNRAVQLWHPADKLFLIVFCRSDHNVRYTTWFLLMQMLDKTTKIRPKLSETGLQVHVKEHTIIEGPQSDVGGCPIELCVDVRVRWDIFSAVSSPVTPSDGWRSYEYAGDLWCWQMERLTFRKRRSVLVGHTVGRAGRTVKDALPVWDTVGLKQ